MQQQARAEEEEVQELRRAATSAPAEALGILIDVAGRVGTGSPRQAALLYGVGPEAVLAVLRAHQGSEAVVACSLALVRYTFPVADKKRVPETPPPAPFEQLWQATVWAMSTHAEFAELQANGCSALAHLLAAGRVEEPAYAVAARLLIGALSLGLREDVAASCPALRVRACEGLLLLCRRSSPRCAREAVASQGGVEALAGAVLVGKVGMECAMSACDALMHLSTAAAETFSNSSSGALVTLATTMARLAKPHPIAEALLAPVPSRAGTGRSAADSVVHLLRSALTALCNVIVLGSPEDGLDVVSCCCGGRALMDIAGPCVPVLKPAGAVLLCQAITQIAVLAFVPVPGRDAEAQQQACVRESAHGIKALVQILRRFEGAQLPAHRALNALIVLLTHLHGSGSSGSDSMAPLVSELLEPDLRAELSKRKTTPLSALAYTCESFIDELELARAKRAAAAEQLRHQLGVQAAQEMQEVLQEARESRESQLRWLRAAISRASDVEERLCQLLQEHAAAPTLAPPTPANDNRGTAASDDELLHLLSARVFQAETRVAAIAEQLRQAPPSTVQLSELAGILGSLRDAKEKLTREYYA
eukprot:m51a1_g9346 hypothetical protein (593) ;mRNA; f:81264-83152